jgi:hypothetical protein
MNDDDFEEDVPESSDNGSRLANLRRNHLDNARSQPRLTVASWDTLFHSIQSRQSRNQTSALLELRDIITHPLFTIKIIPPTLAAILTDVFVRGNTDHNVRLLILRIIETLCANHEAFLQPFFLAELPLKIFNVLTAPRCPFTFDVCLPIINPFLTSHVHTFQFFANDGLLLQFLFTALEQLDSTLERTVIMGSLACYSASRYFDPRADLDAVIVLVNSTVPILSPVFLQSSTSLVGYAIQILASLLAKLPDGPHLDFIISRGLAPLIATLIQPENLKISAICAHCLGHATFCSDIVCQQLADAFFWTAIGDSLSNENLFRECGLSCLYAVYNCLVACPGTAIEVFKNESLRDVIVKAVAEDSPAKVKHVGFDIVNFLIVNLPRDYVLNCAAGFEMVEHIPLIVELSLRENINGSLAAASRIIEVARTSPEEADAVRELAVADVVEPLATYLAECGDPDVRECGEAYLCWVEAVLNS